MQLVFDDSRVLSDILKSGLAVTIARAASMEIGPYTTVERPETIQARAGASDVDIAWQAFAPVEINDVQWSDVLVAFAAVASPVTGRPVEINAKLKMMAGSRCSYRQGELVELVGGSAGTFEISNVTEQTTTFGLAQNATINGVRCLRPLCARAVMGGETAVVTLRSGLAVFLSSSPHGGIVIPPIPSAEFVFDASIGAQANTKLKFNAQNSTFFIQGPGGTLGR